MKALITAALAILPLATAQADQIPRFDVETHCEQVAGFGGDYSSTMYNSCIDQEQGAYNNLKGQWGSLSSRIQDHCEQVAGFGGPGSYTMLESCVQMESSAANNRSEFSFD